MKLPVYLYPNSVTVILDIDNNNKVLELMYQRELVLEKSVKNTIQLQFKNSDQKLLNISPFGNKQNSLVFIMYNNQTHQSVLESPVEILDTGVETNGLKGLAKLTLTSQQLNNLPTGKYRYGIKVLDSDNHYVPAYVDTYYSASGTIEVRSSLDPVLRPTTEIKDFQVFFNRDQDAQRYEFYSGNIFVDTEHLNTASLHTMAFYMTNYIGDVLIEGSQVPDPSTFSDYALIEKRSYTGFTGVDYTNFQGIFNWVRVRYIPAKDPVTNTYLIDYSGKFDKVLYRA